MIGIKISGDGRGSQMGFPTINLNLLQKVPRGVFAISAFWEGKIFAGIGHFGARPTFQKSEFSAEIHLFDFSEKVPDGSEISFCLLKKIREIKKFENTEKLVEQIQKDQKIAKKIHKSQVIN